MGAWQGEEKFNFYSSEKYVKNVWKMKPKIRLKGFI